MAIIGAILGDIAGSQYEFNHPANLDWQNCDLFTDSCYFTDDTVMTLAVKLAIKKNISFEKSYRYLGRKYPNVGYGGMFENWLEDDKMVAYNSFGNGAAMRVSYIGEYETSPIDAIQLAQKSAECTHNHPEGIKGAVVTVQCICAARQGCTKAEIYEYVRKHYSKESYKYSVEYKLADYRDTYKYDVTCQGSVPVAIRCFLESEDYESFLRNVLSLRGDTDTLCAIGGGIAEEFYKGTGFDEDFLLKKYLDKTLYDIVKL